MNSNGKTDKIEQDFSRLMERYNRSKQTIDQLCNDGNRNDISMKSDKPIIQNLNQESVSKEKYTKVRNLNKELKLTLKEYIERTKELEATILGKDDLICKYEQELREQQDNLYNQLQEQKGQIMKEDQQAKFIEDLQKQLQIAKNKLVKKKAKVQLLKDSQKNIDNKFEDQKQTFQQEFERVQRLCEEFSNEIKESERRILELQDQNEELRQIANQKEEERRYIELLFQEEKETTQKQLQKITEIQEEKKIQQITIENQIKKIAELEGQQKINDSKYQEFQNKLNQEKQLANSDLLDTLNKRKIKTKQLQTQIQQLETKLQEKFKDDIAADKIIQEQKLLQSQLQTQLDEQRKKTDLALNEVQFKVQEIKELKNELEKSIQQQKLQDEKLQKYDVQYSIDQKEIQKLIHEIEQFNQENRRLQHALYESDREIDYMRQQQETEILRIEKKVNSLVEELSVLKEENAEWKRTVNDLKRQLQQQEDLTNQFKAKYVKIKQNNKNMENEHRYLEDKVKQLENEKVLGEREALKHTVIQKQQAQSSKIRVLDEIQNMIKQHKLRD